VKSTLHCQQSSDAIVGVGVGVSVGVGVGVAHNVIDVISPKPSISG